MLPARIAIALADTVQGCIHSFVTLRAHIALVIAVTVQSSERHGASCV